MPVTTPCRPLAIVALLLVLMGAATAAPAAWAQSNQAIAAIVNDDIISSRDLESRIALFLATSNLQDTSENRRRLTPEVLRTLIDDALKRQEMRRQNVSVSQAELDRALAQVATQLRLQPPELQEYLARRGVGISALIDQLESEIGWSKAINRIAGDRLTVGAAEIDDELARTRSASGTIEYRLGEIFLPVDDPSEQARVEELALRLVAESRSGANFAALARTFSQGASASAGGDLGWVAREELEPQIEAVVSRMQPGQISDPIRAQGGYFVLALVNRRSQETLPGTKVTVTLRQLFLPLPRGAGDGEVSAQAKAARDITVGAGSCGELEERSRSAGSAMSRELAAVDLQQLPAELQQMIGPMRVGDVTPPLRTPEGFLVIMMCDRTEAGGEAEARTAIERRLREQRLSAASRRQLRELRRAALLDIRV